jgi:phenylpropionate dioxygenase-like ring-hydroxylating dioxygenase large terminal subunit
MREPASLVEDGRVHRAVYVDPAVFAAEMENIFGRAWLYVCHESQIPRPGDYVTARMGRENVICVRHRDGNAYVLANRCRHRGAALCAGSGRAERIVCCYHGWTYDTDGALVDVPLPEGYPAGRIKSPEFDLHRAKRVATYRGFVFASMASEGPTLEQFLGPMASSIDDLVDRAPAGTVTVAGGVSRHAYNGNWKLVLENNNDLLHPHFVHASSISASRRQDDSTPSDGAGEIAVRQMRQNGLPMNVWEGLGIWTSEYGHSFMGDFHDDRRLLAKTDSPEEAEYRRALEARVGATRAAEILSVSRFNTIVYPNLSFMSQFRQMRVVHPIAVDRTEVHTYTFRLEGAPERMFTDAVAFANVVNGVASPILTDDLETYERLQRGLATQADDWIDHARGLGRDVREAGGLLRGATGTGEISVRNQFAAWRRYMTAR